MNCRKGIFRRCSASPERRGFFHWLCRVVAVLLTISAPVYAGPQISLPPPGTHGFPLGASALDLGRYGYVEKEFLMAGSATSYSALGNLAGDGTWDAQPSGITGQYQVRLMVRRPAAPRRFNGTVLVEWLNVSGFVDRSPEWAFMYEEIMRRGYAYVGVTTQYIGARALQSWETGEGARYSGIVHPGDSFSYDIFSQAGRAVRNPQAGEPRPLGPLTPRIRELVAMGQSQSGDRLVTYTNAIQPGAQVYDALIIHSAFSSSPLSQASAAAFPTFGTIPLWPGMPVTPEISTPQPVRIRTDLNQPVIYIGTETEVNSPDIANGLHQQADDHLIRVWEIAGAGHADVDSLAVMDADLAKSGALLPSVSCGDLPTNDGKANGQVSRAAIVALQRWLRRGIRPPIGPRLQIDYSTDPFMLDRDAATGIVRGGIRLPDVEVPVKTLTGVRPAGAGSAFCFLFGGSDPWNADTDSFDGLSYDPSPTPEPDLATLYPTRSAYTFSVFLSSLRALFGGFMLPADFVAVNRAASEQPLSGEAGASQ